MKENAFLDKAVLPDEIQMEKTLGSCYGYYQKLMKAAADYEYKWTFYKGWALKVFRKSKALFYILPYDGSFAVSMAIRENERSNMLNDIDLAPYKQALLNAEKYNEGYGIRFDVQDQNSFNMCFEFVSKLISFR